MKRRGLFGLIGAGVAAPALASVTPAKPVDFDHHLALAENKINEWLKWKFGDLVEVGKFKRATSEYGIAYQPFSALWKATPDAPYKLADKLIDWIDGDLRAGLKSKTKLHQTMVWREPPTFVRYDSIKNEPDILKLKARGHVFVPGPASDNANGWSFESRLWVERHPGKITLDRKYTIT